MSQTQSFIPLVHINRWGQTQTLSSQDNKPANKLRKQQQQQPQPLPQPVSAKIMSTPSTLKKSMSSQSDHSAEDFVKLSPSQRWTPIINVKKPSQPHVSEKPISVPPAPKKAEVQTTHQPTANIEEELTTQNLYKTELCRSFGETGTCRYGSKCQFAHGVSDLRPILRHPKYKTEVCKTFQTIGTCPYGKRCRFIHIPPSQRIPAEKDTPLEVTRNFSDEPLAPVISSTPEPSLQVSLPHVSALPISPISAISVPSPVKFYPSVCPFTSINEQSFEEEFSDDTYTDEEETGEENLALTNFLRLEELLDSLNQRREEEEEEEEEEKPKEVEAKKESERRLSIFQQICSDQAIPV